MTTVPILPRVVRGNAGHDLRAGSVVIAAALVVGSLQQRNMVIALIVAFTPLLFLGVLRPEVLAVVGLGLVWRLGDISHGALPAQVTATDALLALAVAFLVMRAGVTNRGALGLDRLRPFAPVLSVYGLGLVLAFAGHPDKTAAVNSIQHLQILLVPLLVGASILTPTSLRNAILVTVLTTISFAVWFGATYDGESGAGVQKNPAGFLIAVAILVLVAADVFGPWRFLALIPLTYGLFSSQSRGALIGVGTGLLVMLIARPGVHRARLLAVMLPVTLIAAVTFLSVPQGARDRLTTFNYDQSSTQSIDLAEAEAASTIKTRTEFRKDGINLIKAHPVTGIGVGHYLAGSGPTLTDDPHDVFILEAAEGGIPLLLAFVILQVGVVVVLWRRRKNPVAVLALGLQAALLVHGAVDIYWVRGTPVLAWLITGAAMRRPVANDPRSL